MSMPIEQQFIKYIVEQIVDNPDGVEINHTVDDKGILLKLIVEGDDIGRVIGKRGATAQALRTLLRALGTKNDERYNLKIIDPEQPEGPPSPAPREEQQSEPATPVATESNDELAEVASDPDPVEEPEEVAEENSKVAQARRELADLDDLDI